MKYEIDQSNKIERTEKDTIIGLSNDKTYTVLIKRHIKRKIQDEFRKQGKPRVFVYRTFVAGVVLLLKYSRLKSLNKIIVDKEYLGLEKLLKEMFVEMGEKALKKVPDISFRIIGKSSPAHNVSYLTMKRKIKPNRKLSCEEIKKLVF